MRTSRSFFRARLQRGACILFAGGAAFTAGHAVAQSSPVVSREVVQALPSPSTGALDSALQRLAVNARDAGALVDAGFASLDIGDVDAAVGFFSRADSVDPGNARAQAGLGAAYVRSENPYDALLMFEEAERAGAAPLSLAGDRGLALDLVGDTSSAQGYYRKALAAAPNAEVTRRLAVSLAISGDKSGAEAALLPLLKKQDLAAYRARAFVLAITGDAKGAQQIADQVMPRAMSSKIAPYLRYMPRLTPAQQAAAANFGQFPSVAQIGKQDPRAAKYISNIKRPVQTAATAVAVNSAQSALVPAGEPFGSRSGTKTALASSTPRTVTRGQKAAPVATPRAVASTEFAAAAPPTARAMPSTDTGELPPVSGSTGAYTTTVAAASPPIAGRPYAQARVAAAEPSARPSIAISDYPAPTQAPAAVTTIPGFSKPLSPAAPAGSGASAIASYSAAPANQAASAAYGVQSPQVPAVAAVSAQPAPMAKNAVAVTPAAAVVPAVSSGQMFGPSLAEATRPTTAATPAQALSGASMVAASASSTAGASPTISVAPVMNEALPQTSAVEGVSSASPPPAAPTSPAPSVPPAQISLADAFADFTVPTVAERAPGAVDITRITPLRDPSPVEQAAAAGRSIPTSPQLARDAVAAKETATKAAVAAKGGKLAPADPKVAAAKGGKAANAKDAKPKPPAQPSRVWVQLATGRDAAALGYDWRRMAKGNAELFKGRQAYLTVWGQSNRLLTGPFPTASAAQEFVSKLKKEDVASFVFTSKQGEEVKPLDAR